MTRTLPTLPVLAVAGAMLLIARPAGAQERQPPTPADYRHSIMEGMQSHEDALRSLLNGVVDHPDHVLLHAQAIRSLSLMVPDIWPEGSAEGTRAKPEIWANWTDFTSKIDALQEATAALLAAAESGDLEATSDAAGNVGRACRSCHGDYRARAR
jgi:cytochrome c556